MATAEDENKNPYEGRTITMQHFRALDQRGINVFETPKESGVEYTAVKLDFSTAFTSQLRLSRVTLAERFQSAL